MLEAIHLVLLCLGVISALEAINWSVKIEDARTLSELYSIDHLTLSYAAIGIIMLMCASPAIALGYEIAIIASYCTNQYFTEKRLSAIK